MISVIKSAGVLGVEAYLLQVEVDITRSALPKWSTVGLADSEVRESKERIYAAIKNSGYDFSINRITINLAPADVRKEGTALDLPIAIGFLSSSGLIQQKNLNRYLIIGELSLNGKLRPVRGILPMAILASKLKLDGMIVPQANANEASIVSEVEVFGIENLVEAVEFLNGRISILPHQIKENLKEEFHNHKPNIDFDEVAGQYQAKRAIEVAASGGHNLLFSGPPGSGKTLISSRMPTILPPLTFDESLEVTQVYSVTSKGYSDLGLIRQRPFRSPHHSISNAGLVGGGSYPRPGEVSLSHHGVLFLDELGEFKKHILELLRQPLESKEVLITRANTRVLFPADFILLASMNPCPCGYYGHPKIHCQCQPFQIQRYHQKLSGPLLDRIDLQVEVPSIQFEELMTNDEKRENSQTIQKRVIHTRNIQKNRYQKEGIKLNSQLTPKLLKKYCHLDQKCTDLLKGIMNKFCLSARSIDRMIKVSRTIADMNQSQHIEISHLLEAVQYRSLDKQKIF